MHLFDLREKEDLASHPWATMRILSDEENGNRRRCRRMIHPQRMPSLIMKCLFYVGIIALYPAAVAPFALSGLGTSKTNVVLASSNSQNAATATNSNTTDSSALVISPEEAKAIITQAQKLRAEADALRKTLDAEAEARRARELARIDKWIDDFLVADRLQSGDAAAVELLYSVEQVTQMLQDRRMSEEHVMSMFRRLSQLSPASRSKCSPLVELLVDAAGRMDSIDKELQPNKRWSGKVERKLRRRLFARDWNIELDDLEEGERNGY